MLLSKNSKFPSFLLFSISRLETCPGLALPWHIPLVGIRNTGTRPFFRRTHLLSGDHPQTQPTGATHLQVSACEDPQEDPEQTVASGVIRAAFATATLASSTCSGRSPIPLFFIIIKTVGRSIKRWLRVRGAAVPPLRLSWVSGQRNRLGRTSRHSAGSPNGATDDLFLYVLPSRCSPAL